jgi:hypothetical protein
MAERKPKTDLRISGPPEWVDDLAGDYEEISLLGRTLILDGEYYDTEILGRWIGWDAARNQLVEEGRQDELDDYLFAMFADAVLPANPSYTTESLRTAFPTYQIWVGLLRHFFRWREGRLLSGEAITVKRVVRPAISYPAAIDRSA